MDEIRQLLRDRDISVTVVSIPAVSRIRNQHDSNEEEWLFTHQSFASVLDAEFVDGVVAFRDLSDDQIDDGWLPYDSHWGQQGSNRFASFMSKYLSSLGDNQSANDR